MFPVLSLVLLQAKTYQINIFLVMYSWFDWSSFNLPYLSNSCGNRFSFFSASVLEVCSIPTNLYRTNVWPELNEVIWISKVIHNVHLESVYLSALCEGQDALKWWAWPFVPHSQLLAVLQHNMFQHFVFIFPNTGQVTQHSSWLRWIFFPWRAKSTPLSSFLWTESVVRTCNYEKKLDNTRRYYLWKSLLSL